MARSTRIRNPRLLRLRRRNKPERMRAHKILFDRLLDLRHMARHTRAPRTPLRMMRMFAHRPTKPRRIVHPLRMARQAKRIPPRNQVRRILIAMHLVAIEAPHLPVIHIALHKIVPLHAVLVRRHIRILIESSSSPALAPPAASSPPAALPAQTPLASRSTSPQSDSSPAAPGYGTECKYRCRAHSPAGSDSQCSPASDAPRAGSPAHDTSRIPHSTPSPGASPRCSSPSGTHRTSAPSAGQSSSARRTAPTSPSRSPRDTAATRFFATSHCAGRG